MIENVSNVSYVTGVSYNGNIGSKSILDNSEPSFQDKLRELSKKDESNFAVDKKEEDTLEKVLEKKDGQTIAEKTAEFVAKVREKQAKAKEEALERNTAEGNTGFIIDTKA